MAQHRSGAESRQPGKPTNRTRGTVPRRGRLFRALWPLTSYVLTNVSVAIFWVFFFVLNRTKVFGREHIGDRPNTLLLSNHQSMIDSFLVGLVAFFPRSLVKPYLIPWNPAAVENFYKNRIMAWLADNWRCIPVRPGRRDLKALHRMIEALPGGVMTLFPEGTRTRTGDVRRGRPGAGLLILATRPKVVPVAIEGMNDVLPVGKKIPRLGQRIYIKYGPAIDYSEFLDQPRTRQTAQALVDKIMDTIRSQHEELRRFKRGESA